MFDFYGTLTRGRTAAESEAARGRLADLLDLPAADFDAEMSATVDERFRGAGGDVPASLRWVLSRLGRTASDETIARAAEDRLAAERAFGEPRPEAAEILRQLRDRGLRVGVISDCSAELPVYFPTLSIAPLVDAAVFSFVTGDRKPEPANYLACCDALGVRPRECVYVGDGGSDELAGARAVGMRPLHLSVPAEADALVYGRHVEWDGPVITSLPQVLDHV